MGKIFIILLYQVKRNFGAYNAFVWLCIIIILGNYIPTDGKVQTANHMVITNNAKHFSNVCLTFKVVFKVQHLVVTSYSVTSGSSDIV